MKEVLMCVAILIVAGALALGLGFASAAAGISCKHNFGNYWTCSGGR